MNFRKVNEVKILQKKDDHKKFLLEEKYKRRIFNDIYGKFNLIMEGSLKMVKTVHKHQYKKTIDNYKALVVKKR